MKILVTGGAGYIGSHSCVCLLEQGYDVVVVDNLSNSCAEALKRVEEITSKKIVFYQMDLRDKDGLKRLFLSHKIDSVIHFAGLKSVAESVNQPLKYYANNLVSAIVLLEAMQDAGIKKLVFSSSATVYGVPESVPIKEDAKTEPINPYGQTKLAIERMLFDLANADPDWGIIILRYFNPAGAHESGLIGEDPAGIPNNLMPYLTQVAIGRLAVLKIFGNDYPTPDGTGIRDYIHVMDLAEGHIAALDMLWRMQGIKVFNLGTGKGYSVHEVLKTFERACGKKIPFSYTKRRPGDVAACYADPSLANKELGWKAKRSLYDMCKDAWAWQQKNPNGYKTLRI